MVHETAGSVLQYMRRMFPRSAGVVDDGQLLRRFIDDKDEKAFELLVWRHQRMVFTLCRRILHNAHDAEDAFQATFLALARKASTVRRQSSIAAWLHQVACRIAVRLRSSKDRIDLANCRQAPNPLDPATEASERETAGLLHEEISRLPEKLRVPVVMCYLQGATCREAAEQLGWPRGTLATRLARARKLLARRLTKRGITLSAAALPALLIEQSSFAETDALLPLSVRAAATVAGGRAAPAFLSAKVLALTQGVLTTMFFTKCKYTLCALACLGLLLFTGGGVALRYGLSAQPAHETERFGNVGVKKKRPTTDKQKIQGVWICESIESGKKKAKDIELLAAYAAFCKFTFRGDNASISILDEPKKGTFRLDSSKTPKEIDISLSGAEKVVGIYKLDKNRLTICTAGPSDGRPSKFAALDKQMLLVFQRQGTGKKAKNRNPADVKNIAELSMHIKKLFEQLQRARAEAERSRAIAELERRRAAIQQKFLMGKLSNIDIKKNTVSLILQNTSLEVPNVPFTVSAKFRLGKKECLITDLKKGMNASLKISTVKGRTFVTEIRAYLPKKK